MRYATIYSQRQPLYSSIFIQQEYLVIINYCVNEPHISNMTYNMHQNIKNAHQTHSGQGSCSLLHNIKFNITRELSFVL